MIEEIDIETIDAVSGAETSRAVPALERGAVLLFGRLQFPLLEAERRMILDRAAASTGKQISFDARTGLLKHAELDDAGRQTLTGLMMRYAEFAGDLVDAIAPAYRGGVRRGRASFRPADITSRDSSWRQDDKRRHVDAFPTTPTHGARILRVFLNVDQSGRPRRWRLGPDFRTYAETFLPRVAAPLPGQASVLSWLGLTKSRRSEYDRLMLGLHDEAKRDTEWQASTPAEEVDFFPGQVWALFTDQVPHAAIAGCNAIEMSFYVDAEMLVAPEQAPLAVLAQLTGRDVARRLI